jgi:hypothetical protein
MVLMSDNVPHIHLVIFTSINVTTWIIDIDQKFQIKTNAREQILK